MSNIVETATNAGSLKTLVAAVQAAGLGPRSQGRDLYRVRADR